MAKSCPDCGCRLSDGMCPNCHEELWILEKQMNVDGWDEPLSDNFVEAVRWQEKAARRNRQE